MTAYEQGYQAWLDGHSLATNPYWSSWAAAVEWANGWRDAQLESYRGVDK